MRYADWALSQLGDGTFFVLTRDVEHEIVPLPLWNLTRDFRTPHDSVQEGQICEIAIQAGETAALAHLAVGVKAPSPTSGFGGRE